MQRIIGLIGSILTLPLIAVLAIVVRLNSPGPPIYRAVRNGAGGEPFTCFKLRTMHWTPRIGGPAISIADDPRVTQVGRWLRRVRLDELPQLWNVARGEMYLIGPRPEDPRYVDLRDPLHRAVFTATPGITGPAQLLFASEADLLRGSDPDSVYRSRVLPAKLRIDIAYLERRRPSLDAWILIQTIATAAGHPPTDLAVTHRLGLTGSPPTWTDGDLEQ